MNSYEVSIGLITILVVLCVVSLNLTQIVIAHGYMWYKVPLWRAAMMLLVSALAKTNRVPFDLMKRESELVSVFNMKYPCMSFMLFFLADYANIISMPALSAVFGLAYA
uniref:NADH-ubiquinone oxidoreductase chain 1 n=1 Tax=Amphimedon queenslandica TaxID=400682 RepID=A0A1X7UV81_AMPQE